MKRALFCSNFLRRVSWRGFRLLVGVCGEKKFKNTSYRAYHSYTLGLGVDVMMLKLPKNYIIYASALKLCKTPQWTILIAFFGISVCSLPSLANSSFIFWSNSRPFTHSPKTTCLPSHCFAAPSVTKNWEPLLFLPVFPMLRTPSLSCLPFKPPSSSLNFFLQMDSPPVPLLWTKSPD